MAGSQAATAQQQQAAPADQGIPEIVVTAQQRQQSLQEVPLSVTAITGDFIQENHLEDFSDLARITPGFNSGTNYGFVRNSSMRGISNNQFGFADDPSIAMYVDGVYQGRGGTGMQVNALYDVDRVEIVKGPQATLFGRSSIAGAISVIDKQPTTDKVEEVGNLSFGEHARIFANAAFNAPISPDFAIRVALDTENQDGYIKNLAGGRDLEPLDVKAGRIIARYTGIDRLEASLKFGYEQRKQDGSTYSTQGLPDFTADIATTGDQNYSNFYILDVVGTLKYDITDKLKATSTTSWRHVNNQYVEKYDGLPTIVGGPYSQSTHDGLFQEDLKLNYEGDHRLSIVAGASYFKENQGGFVGNWVDGNPTFTGFAFTGVPTPGLTPGSYANAFFESGNFTGDYRGYSLFTDGTVGFPGFEDLTVTAGVRYNYDKKSFQQDIPDPATLPANAGKIFAGAYYNWGYYTGTPLGLTRDWHDTSWRVATNYDINKNNTVYFQWSQGWKAGGIDTFKVIAPGFPFFFGLDAAAAGARPNDYNPEHSDNYEIGLKGKAFGRTFGYNIAAYYYTYQDLQVSVPQGGSSVIENVGQAEGKGVEAELRYVPDEHWDFYANAAYNYTTITAFAQLPNQVGEPLNQAPRWNGAAGVTYSFDAPADLGGRFSVGGSSYARSGFRTDNILYNGVPGYFLFNTRAGYAAEDERYSVGLFADNIFNRFTYNRYEPQQAFLYPVTSRSVIGPPRIIGVDLHVSF